MRRISTHKLSKHELIMATFERLVTGEWYTMTTGRNIGDFDAALECFISMATSYFLGE